MNNIFVQFQALHKTLDGSDLQPALDALRDAADAAGYEILTQQRTCTGEPVVTLPASMRAKPEPAGASPGPA